MIRLCQVHLYCSTSVVSIPYNKFTRIEFINTEFGFSISTGSIPKPKSFCRPAVCMYIISLNPLPIKYSLVCYLRTSGNCHCNQHETRHQE